MEIKGKSMGGLSFGHVVLLLAVVFFVFGANRIPQVMKDMARGLRAFKDGLKEGESESPSEDKINKVL